MSHNSRKLDGCKNKFGDECLAKHVARKLTSTSWREWTSLISSGWPGILQFSQILIRDPRVFAFLVYLATNADAVTDGIRRTMVTCSVDCILVSASPSASLICDSLTRAVFAASAHCYKQLCVCLTRRSVWEGRGR